MAPRKVFDPETGAWSVAFESAPIAVRDPRLVAVKNRLHQVGGGNLALHQEPSPPLDEPSKEELLKVLAELLLEALGVESAEKHGGKEQRDEFEDHA